MTDTGSKCYSLIEKLFPICRSITGYGVRQTLNIISKHIPIKVKEVPSGTQVFDWNVPKEWNIRDAYIKNSNGDKIVDFKKSNLHVVNYSIPVHKKLPLSELQKTFIPFRSNPIGFLTKLPITKKAGVFVSPMISFFPCRKENMKFA